MNDDAMPYRSSSVTACGGCNRMFLKLNRFGLCARCTAGMVPGDFAKLDGVRVVPLREVVEEHHHTRTVQIPHPRLRSVFAVASLRAAAGTTVASLLVRWATVGFGW